MEKKKRVLILGDMRGVYRIQNVVKYFIDRPREYSVRLNTFWCKFRPIKYLFSLFFDPFIVASSNVVYVNILNVDIDILYQLFWAKLFRKKVLVDYYISIYEKVVDDEKWFKEGSLLAKLARTLDKYYYWCATKAIFLDEAEQKHYCSLINAKRQNKNIIVPLCVERNDQLNFDKAYGKDEFSICWWGSYLPLHGLDKIIKAAQIVNKKHDNIRWYFFGNSDEKAKPYIELAEQLGVRERCVFESSYTMKNGKLKEFLVNNCNLALGNFGSSIKGRLVLNNKSIDACAMKLVLLTGNAKAYYCFFDGEKDIFMSNVEPEDIAEAIFKIYSMDALELKERVEATYDIYDEQFSPESFYKLMDEIMLNLYK